MVVKFPPSITILTQMIEHVVITCLINIVIDMIVKSKIVFLATPIDLNGLILHLPKELVLRLRLEFGRGWRHLAGKF